jgi:hypothetical protein
MMTTTKISHTKIKQPSFGEKRSKLTYTKISQFTVWRDIDGDLFSSYGGILRVTCCHHMAGYVVLFWCVKFLAIIVSSVFNFGHFWFPCV